MKRQQSREDRRQREKGKGCGEAQQGEIAFEHEDPMQKHAHEVSVKCDS